MAGRGLGGWSCILQRSGCGPAKALGGGRMLRGRWTGTEPACRGQATSVAQEATQEEVKTGQQWWSCKSHSVPGTDQSPGCGSPEGRTAAGCRGRMPAHRTRAAVPQNEPVGRPRDQHPGQAQYGRAAAHAQVQQRFLGPPRAQSLCGHPSVPAALSLAWPLPAP